MWGDRASQGDRGLDQVEEDSRGMMKERKTGDSERDRVKECVSRTRERKAMKAEVHSVEAAASKYW